jgi:hypothetical protein
MAVSLPKGDNTQSKGKQHKKPAEAAVKLKMGKTCCSETSVCLQTTQRYNPKGRESLNHNAITVTLHEDLRAFLRARKSPLCASGRKMFRTKQTHFLCLAVFVIVQQK